LLDLLKNWSSPAVESSYERAESAHEFLAHGEQ
jgi:hypothetical protein